MLKGCCFRMSSNVRGKHTALVKQLAAQLGFDFCGISKAQFLEKEASKLDMWLKQGHHGKMSYMSNHFDKRLDPTKLVPGAKSVVSVVYNYYPDKKQRADSYHVAKYAYGKDYHFVIKSKLKQLMGQLQEEVGEVNGRVFVDSAPVMERQWAARSGLGWLGKNSLLLNRNAGSFFFLAELIIDLDLEEDGPTGDFCGTCTKCVDACPTDAIIGNGVVNANNCISYLTIELKDDLPVDVGKNMQDWIFGCDICQDVCPWNRFSRPHNEHEFMPSEMLLDMDKKEWKELTHEVFNEVFQKSAVKRTKYSGLMRNIEAVSEH